jgi:RsiW-degrading membrane proteinase PrsW (M82 family)
MLLYLTLVICAVVMGRQVYRYDLHDHEPIRALFIATVLGAALMWIAGRAQVMALAMLGTWSAQHWNFSISAAAGLIEEAAKVLGVLAIVWFNRKWFNDPMDGLVYGSFVGLGAAIEESVALLTGHRHSEFLAITEPVRLMGHLVMGGIAGAGIGLWRMKLDPWRVVLPSCWVCAVTLHFAWDEVAFSAADAGKMLPWHTAGSMVLMVAGLVAYRCLICYLEPYSRRQFEEIPQPIMWPRRSPVRFQRSKAA